MHMNPASALRARGFQSRTYSSCMLHDAILEFLFVLLCKEPTLYMSVACSKRHAVCVAHCINAACIPHSHAVCIPHSTHAHRQYCAQHIRVCDLLRVGLEGECFYVTSQRRQPCLCESASQNQAVPGLEAYADGIHGRPGRSQAEAMDQPGALGCHNPRQDSLRPAAKAHQPAKAISCSPGGH